MASFGIGDRVQQRGPRGPVGPVMTVVGREPPRAGHRSTGEVKVICEYKVPVEEYSYEYEHLGTGLETRTSSFSPEDLQNLDRPEETAAEKERNKMGKTKGKLAKHKKDLQDAKEEKWLRRHGASGAGGGE